MVLKFKCQWQVNHGLGSNMEILFINPLLAFSKLLGLMMSDFIKTKFSKPNLTNRTALLCL